MSGLWGILIGMNDFDFWIVEINFFNFFNDDFIIYWFL